MGLAACANRLGYRRRRKIFSIKKKKKKKQERCRAYIYVYDVLKKSSETFISILEHSRVSRDRNVRIIRVRSSRVVRDIILDFHSETFVLNRRVLSRHARQILRVDRRSLPLEINRKVTRRSEAELKHRRARFSMARRCVRVRKENGTRTFLRERARG